MMTGPGLPDFSWYNVPDFSAPRQYAHLPDAHFLCSLLMLTFYAHYLLGIFFRPKWGLFI
jgi:hypothetical protein